MLRDRTIYADFTESAALRLPAKLVKGEGRDVLDNFRTLYDSILRNFPYVSDIWFFIEGNAISLDLEHLQGTVKTDENRTIEAAAEDSGT